MLHAAVLAQAAELDGVAMVDLACACKERERDRNNASSMSLARRGTSITHQVMPLGTLTKASADPASFLVVPKVQNACSVIVTRAAVSEQKPKEEAAGA